MPVTLAIIGAGTISQSVHIPLARRAGFDLRWVCDLSPSRAAEIGRITAARSTTDPAEVFGDPGVDAVLLATPGSHAALAADALRAGKHVLAEKPLALTIADVDELQALSRSTGRIVQVGYMKMYDPLTARARAEVAQLDGVRLVRITVAHPDDDPQVAHLRLGTPPADADASVIAAFETAELAAAERALPGASPEVLAYYRGVLNGSVIHEFSLLRALGLALPTAWQAETFPRITGPEPACLLASAAVGDARYLLSWNWLPSYPEYGEELAILASNGRLAYHLAKPYLLEERSTLTVERHDGLERQATTYREGYETGFLRQLDAFGAAIGAKAPASAIDSGLGGARQDIHQMQLLAQAIAASLGQQCDTEREVGR